MFNQAVDMELVRLERERSMMVDRIVRGRADMCNYEELVRIPFGILLDKIESVDLPQLDAEILSCRQRVKVGKRLMLDSEVSMSYGIRYVLKFGFNALQWLLYSDILLDLHPVWGIWVYPLGLVFLWLGWLAYTKVGGWLDVKL